MKLTIIVTIALIILVTIISAHQDKINDAKFDKCYEQYQKSNIDRSDYDKFMRQCYENL